MADDITDLKERLARLEAMVCGRVLESFGERKAMATETGQPRHMGYLDHRGTRFVFYRLKRGYIQKLQALGSAVQWLAIDNDWGSHEVGVLIDENFNVGYLDSL